MPEQVQKEASAIWNRAKSSNLAQYRQKKE